MRVEARWTIYAAWLCEAPVTGVGALRCLSQFGPAEELPGAASLPRLYDEDYAILALIDRAGLVPTSLIRRAVLPGRASRTVNDRLVKLYRHGLLGRHPTNSKRANP